MNMLRRSAGALSFLGRGAVVAIAGNLSLAALSLALGLSLWLYVTDRENPEEEATLNSPVPVQFVNVPNDLAIANTATSSVRIRVEAPENELDRLSPDDFEARVDLGGLAEGQTSLPVEVTPPSRRVNVLDVQPARIAVTLEPVRSKEVPAQVSLVGSPQQGFEVVGQTIEPERVTVTGAESLVALVDSAVGEVNLTGERLDIADERVPLTPRDARGGEISRITVAPDTARVSVDLEQREFSLALVVNPSVQGTAADGYNVVSITVDPRLVLVTGPIDALQSIDAVRGITTEDVTIADARDDVVRTVPLIVPPGARLLGSPTVQVRVDIEPARGEFSFRIVPQVRNVGNGLALTQAEPITVTLAGEIPRLQSLTPESITVTADAQDLGPGVYSLPLQITAPPGTTVVRAEPPQLGITLTQRQ